MLTKTMIIVFQLFYYQTKSQLLGIKRVFKHNNISKCWVSNHKNTSNCHPLETVGGDRETKLQVVANLLELGF